MGNSHNHNIWYDKSKRKVILLGFENSGKSTFLEYIKSGKFFENYNPSSDFELCEKKVHGQTWLIFDLAGGIRQRVFWSHHFNGTQGVVYLIDVSDKEERIRESVEEVKKVFKQDVLSNTSFLVLLNKVDKLEKGFTRESLIEKYDLKECTKDPRIYVELCCIKTDYRVTEGLEWLSKNMVAL